MLGNGQGFLNIIAFLVFLAHGSGGGLVLIGGQHLQGDLVGLLAFHAHAGHGMTYFHTQPGFQWCCAVAVFIARGGHLP